MIASLASWLAATFGEIGGGIVFVVLMILLAFVLRYLFWGVIILLFGWKIHEDVSVNSREGRR